MTPSPVVSTYRVDTLCEVVNIPPPLNLHTYFGYFILGPITVFPQIDLTNIPQNAIVRLEFGGVVILDLSQAPSGTCKLTASYDDIRGRGVTGGSQWDKCMSALP